MDMRYRKGFTLVELSIVIVIIGLIVAGVMAGQSLVRQAKLRLLVTDADKYRVAINTFKLQYNALPGDMTNAYNYWGNACDATDTNCNGNGDRQIERLMTPANDLEMYRAWQHLSLSGIIPGSYTGIGYGDADQANIGQNIPASSFATVGYLLRWDTFGTLVSRNRLILAGFTTDNINSWAFLRPGESYSIDTKTDDGMISKGRVVAFWSGTSHAADNCSDGAGAYKLTETDTTCRLSFDAE